MDLQCFFIPKIEILVKLKWAYKKFQKTAEKYGSWIDLDITKKKIIFSWWFIFRIEGAMSP